MLNLSSFAPSLFHPDATVWQQPIFMHLSCCCSHHEIFKCANVKFTVSGRSQQTYKHTHECAQCSHTSVGLAQAYPNYTIYKSMYWLYIMYENNIVCDYKKINQFCKTLSPPIANIGFDIQIPHLPILPTTNLWVTRLLAVCAPLLQEPP